MHTLTLEHIDETKDSTVSVLLLNGTLSILGYAEHLYAICKAHWLDNFSGVLFIGSFSIIPKNRRLYRPSVTANPAAKGIVLACFPSEKVFFQIVFCAFNCYANCVGFIVGLFSGRGPSAITRLIMPINVNSINAVAVRWPWPKVFIERFKIFIEEFYASRSVVFIIRSAFVGAPEFCARKNSHFDAFVQTMNGLSCPTFFVPKTSAAFCGPPCKVVRMNPCDSTASASTPPHRSLVLFRALLNPASKAYNRKPSESLFVKVFKGVVFWMFLNIYFGNIVLFNKSHYKRKTQNPPNELLLHNEGIRPELIQLKGGFRDEGTVSKSNLLCSTRNIRIVSGLSNKKAA